MAVEAREGNTRWIFLSYGILLWLHEGGYLWLGHGLFTLHYPLVCSVGVLCDFLA